MKKYQCKCCGYYTLDMSPEGSYEICPVCYWEDDSVQSKDSDYTGGANIVSLNVAKTNFSSFGASDRRFIKYVRSPSLEERGI